MPLIHRYSTKYDATSMMDMFKTIAYKGGKMERKNSYRFKIKGRYQI